MSNPKTAQNGRTLTEPRPDIDPGAILAAVDVPEDLDEAELALTQAASAALTPLAAAAAAEPAMDPPGTPGAVRIGSAGAFPTVKVLSLYSSAHPVNGWAYLDGIGWRRFTTANPSAHVNLGMLANGARAQGTPTPVRHEADNQIHEIYLW